MSSNSGLVFNILISRNLHVLDKICNFSESFCKFLMFVLSQVPESLFHGLIKFIACLLRSMDLFSTNQLFEFQKFFRFFQVF